MPASFLQSYFSVLVPLIALDVLWLGVVARTFYRTHIGYLMREGFAWVPALIFYLLYATALVVFVIQPASASSRPVLTALWRGAFFGLIAYGTYNLTNQATIKGWPLIITITDMSWGTVATAIACAISVFFITKYL